MSRKNDDMAFWEAFNKNPNKKTFNELYNQMRPALVFAMRKAKINSNLPPSVFDIEGANQFYKSVTTFDPNRGTALATKVIADVGNKVNRLNTDYQNIGKITESRSYMIGPMIRATAYLQDRLGREPSPTELADEMGVPVKTVTTLQKEMRQDLISEDVFESEYVDLEDVEDTQKSVEVYYELNPIEQTVFDYVTGSHGKPELRIGAKPDWNAIAQKMHTTPEDVKNIHKRVVKVWNRR